MEATTVTDVPRTLGRYQLLARLATGGMGEVFLARLEGAAGFEKLYAVKRILPHLASEPRFREMLIAEAQIAARLSHPNICQVYELGETDAQLYIAMEYLEGTSLHGLLRARGKARAPLELGCFAAVLRQICDALHNAHDLRDRDGAPLDLVHRDVSPGNIFVCTSGSVKVLDFGIAKIKHGAQTQTGTVKGKYAYMAPEQLRGGALDRRADLFALGAVAFEMLALRRLFQRDTDYLTFRAVLEEPIPDVRRYRPDAGEGVAAAIAKALERDPEHRWDTARAFCDAVIGALESPAWSEEQVSAFVQSTMANELAQTSRMITQVLDGARDGVLVSLGEAPIPSVSEADELPAVDAELVPTQPERAPPTAVPAAPAAPIPAGRTRALVIGALALVVVIGAVLVVYLRPRDEPQAPVIIDRRDAPTRASDMKAVAPFTTALNECATRHPTALRSATATIRIGRDGAVRDTSFEPVDFEPALAACIVDVLHGVPFAARQEDSLLSLTLSLPGLGRP